MERFTLSLLCLFFLILSSFSLPTSSINLDDSSISAQLFESLEELARIVDITYCVGSTGIQKPFKCAGRCHEFEGFELVEQWKTGILMSDSCGYVAISHPPFAKRIIVAFRGTYSIANTVVDLSTTPAEYLPYPSEDGENDCVTASGATANLQEELPNPADPSESITTSPNDEPCTNCTVHAGFLASWKNTRCIVTPLIESARAQYPDYQLTLVGHSLGGAVASLASLEFLARGWNPQVTTFGEPRIGNQVLVDYIDRKFDMTNQDAKERTFRRVTHADDPVPLLPLEEWGYKMHAGEIYISKPNLPPSRSDLHHCIGDEDSACIAGAAASSLPTTSSSSSSSSSSAPSSSSSPSTNIHTDGGNHNIDIPALLHALSLSEQHSLDLDLSADSWPLHIPSRYRLWELFFAHRDYFWRLGLCVPGGDPRDWWRPSPEKGNETDSDPASGSGSRREELQMDDGAEAARLDL